jgi:hypothetical protein
MQKLFFIACIMLLPTLLLAQESGGKVMYVYMGKVGDTKPLKLDSISDDDSAAKRTYYFSADNTFTISTFTLDDDGRGVEHKTNGKWSMAEKTITLIFEDGTTQTGVFEISSVHGREQATFIINHARYMQMGRSAQ